MLLFDPHEHPFPEVQYVAIAICKTGEPDQRHVGFIFATDDELRTFCDLAWHFFLRFTDDPQAQPDWALSKLYWQELVLGEQNRKVIAAFLISLRNDDSDIPYGIDVHGPCFSPEGSYIPQPAGKGMTCATFIAQVYESLSFPLIDTSTWPSRHDDAQWHQAIIQQLRNRASEEHIRIMESDIGCVRFRPEEITSATQQNDRPVTFQQCIEMAEEIRALCA